MEVDNMENKNLNLSEFINYLNLEMILNNDIYSKYYDDFETENFNELFNDFLMDSEEDLKISENTKTQINNLIKQDLRLKEMDNLFNILDINYLLKYLILYYDYDINKTIADNTEQLENYFHDYFHELYEVYQYFIISNHDIDKWIKYTNYPIFYNYEIDLYLIGITHYGISWKFISTDFKKEY